MSPLDDTDIARVAAAVAADVTQHAEEVAEGVISQAQDAAQKLVTQAEGAADRLARHSTGEQPVVVGEDTRFTLKTVGLIVLLATGFVTNGLIARAAGQDAGMALAKVETKADKAVEEKAQNLSTAVVEIKTIVLGQKEQADRAEKTSAERADRLEKKLDRLLERK